MMRNSFLPSLPSEFFSIGSNEFRMPNLEAPSTLMDARMNMYSNSGFYAQSKAFNCDNWLRSVGDHVSNIPAQPIFDLPSGCEFFAPICDTIYQQPSKKPLVQQYTAANSHIRKDQSDQSTELISGGEQFSDPSSNIATLNEWKKNKRKWTASPEEQFLHQNIQNDLPEIPRCQIQVRGKRSQKVGDKITALQKLVSPYGKTDTASVLQEASLYIKLLQEQIQNLLQMLSTSYGSIRALEQQLCAAEAAADSGEVKLDLRSRGLCLVPITSIQEAEKENGGESHSLAIYQGGLSSWC